jgi:hypothetical protein
MHGARGGASWRDRTGAEEGRREEEIEKCEEASYKSQRRVVCIAAAALESFTR